MILKKNNSDATLSNRLNKVNLLMDEPMKTVCVGVIKQYCRQKAHCLGTANKQFKINIQLKRQQ